MRSSKILNYRYKLAKILSFLPSTQKNILSDYEDMALRKKFYDNLWRASADALNFDYEDLGYGYWKITDSTGRFVRGTGANVEVDTVLSLIMAGNKPLVHKLVGNTDGYRIAKFCEYDLQKIEQAVIFFRQAKSPCVIKPAQDTGAGTGVTMNINSERALIKASIQASVWSKKLLIEETIKGSSYRLLVLNDQVLSTIRRDPPQVIGDGNQTIKELILDENDRRMKSDKIISLFPIQIDLECKNTLQMQSLTLKSVPAVKEIITVKDVVNQNSSEQNVDISDQVHPDIIKTSIEASRSLGLKLAGVDVLTENISLPLSETGGVINEINGTPGLHHHYLISKPQQTNITEQILEFCMIANASRN